MTTDLERRARNYEDRVTAAGGTDALTTSLVKAVKQARRVQAITVIGLILLLGVSAVLALTVIDANKTAGKAALTARRSAENGQRGRANSKQANDIVRCLTKAKKIGKCLGSTVPAGSPGSQGLRGQSGLGGVPGPVGPRGEGAVGPSGLPGLGKPGGQGPIGPSGKDGQNGQNGLVGAEGATGAKGAEGATGPAGSAGPDGPAGPTGPAGPPGTIPPGTTLLCQPPAPDGTQTCTVQ